jgi:hypothetical protein
MVTILFAPAALGAESMPGDLDGPHYVLGEKRDSGLGDLSANAAAEFRQEGYHVVGESLDSGLGDLRPSYSAPEFLRQAGLISGRVPGEKLDSGLGELTL